MSIYLIAQCKFILAHYLKKNKLFLWLYKTMLKDIIKKTKNMDNQYIIIYI